MGYKGTLLTLGAGLSITKTTRIQGVYNSFMLCAVFLSMATHIQFSKKATCIIKEGKFS